MERNSLDKNIPGKGGGQFSTIERDNFLRNLSEKEKELSVQNEILNKEFDQIDIDFEENEKRIQSREDYDNTKRFLDQKKSELMKKSENLFKDLGSVFIEQSKYEK